MNKSKDYVHLCLEKWWNGLYRDLHRKGLVVEECLNSLTRASSRIVDHVGVKYWREQVSKHTKEQADMTAQLKLRKSLVLLSIKLYGVN